MGFSFANLHFFLRGVPTGKSPLPESSKATLGGYVARLPKPQHRAGITVKTTP
jgi:hypothetical protein